jgi:beta-ureidopropionase / N-carbamoyl-L-amino-acid hydrolase
MRQFAPPGAEPLPSGPACPSCYAGGMAAAQSPSSDPLRIEVARLRQDLQALGRIGLDPDDGGLYRLAFTPADLEGKRWLRERLEEADIPWRVDGAGNHFGRLEGADPEAPAVLIGSHLDTVPCAGTLDGSLGVITGLECLRRLKESGVRPRRPVELVAFSDEEGRFGGMFGSQAFVGDITPQTLHEATALDGTRLEDAMRACGLEPFRALEARRDPATLHSYLELHIEQGPVLDRLQKSVGIVEAITGLFRWVVHLRGEANHAGTTPMAMRHDAFMGLADFAHEIPRILEENGGEQSRATIGKAQILPGAPNTVPGLVEFSLDARDTDPGVLDALRDAFRRALQAIARRRSLMFSFEEQSRLEPVPCDPRLVGLLTRHAEALGLTFERMPSGAAHDAQLVARITPTAMIFVPSREGRSHSPAEWTAWDDIEAGANLALQVVHDLATRA